jgi:hypothetical protein
MFGGSRWPCALVAPPAGWSLRLLADTMVELKMVDSISHRAVGEYLKKTTSSRGNTGTGVSDK